MAEFLSADLLILLTDVDGVMDKPPELKENLQVVSSVSRNSWAKLELGISNKSNGQGTGGMATKIQAARSAVEQGGIAVIANGKTKNILERVLKGENMGTLFTE